MIETHASLFLMDLNPTLTLTLTLALTLIGHIGLFPDRSAVPPGMDCSSRELQRNAKPGLTLTLTLTLILTLIWRK